MARERTAEQMKRLGERRMNTAIISVAIVYALVTLAVIGGFVFVFVYLISELF